MNCLSDELIQMYIDGEVSDSEMIRLKAHIGECRDCAQRVSEQRKLSQDVIASLNHLVDDIPDIPEFIEPFRTRLPGKKYLYRIILPIAAACIILFILVFSLDRNPEPGIDIMVLSGIESEIDGNLPISEQEITYTVIESSTGAEPERENVQLQTN